MSQRIDQINELIGQKVSGILHRDVLSPDDYFTIIKVDTSKDLGYCDIYLSFLNKAQELLNEIKSNRSQINTELAKKLKTRKTPKIRFHLDESSEEFNRIDKLLDQI